MCVCVHVMLCIVTGATTMPDIATAEVDTIPGEQKMNMFFLSQFPHLLSTEVRSKRSHTRLIVFLFFDNN